MDALRGAVEDQVPRRQGMGKFADELAFAPHSPQQSEVDAALRLFNPVSVEFHQVRECDEYTTSILHTC